MGHSVRLELTLTGLLVIFANHYTTRVLSFNFILWSAGTKSSIRQVLFSFLLIITRPSCQTEIIIIIILSLELSFHISVSRWFFTGVLVTASLLKSPGLFLVFWPSSIMLSFGWSPLVRQLPSPLVPLVILYLLFQTHQLQLV